VEIVRAHFWLDYNSAAYDNVGTNLYLGYSSGGVITGTLAGAGFADQANDEHAVIRPLANSVVPVAADAVEVETGGDWYAAAGDSPIKYRIEYRLRTLEFTP